MTRTRPGPWSSLYERNGGRMTLRLEEGAPGRGRRIRFERPAVLLPLHGGVLRFGSGTQGGVLDRSTLLVAAPGCTQRLEAVSHRMRLLSLEMGDALVEEVVELYATVGLDRERYAEFLSETSLLPRSVWVHELCHRYLFERQVCDRHDNRATQFLESELAKEIYFLCRDRERARWRPRVVPEHTPVLERALALIEERLFEDLSVARLAKACHTSQSSLLRAFRRELACAPSEYVRARRLDEALVMVRSGAYSVSEVADRVGYATVAAFSHAFHARFGRRPSSFRPKGAASP